MSMTGDEIKENVILGNEVTPESEQDNNDAGQASMTEKSESAPKRKVRKPKVGKAKIRSKKYQEANALVDHQQRYSLVEAIELAQKTSYTKFPGSLEAHINTSQKGIRGLVSLPFASGKKLTILAFGKDAKDAGADIVGDEDTIKEIQSGKLSFDVIVSTPEWMSKLAPAAKILGPRGLMPNPKSGTVTENLKKAVEDLQAGKVEYKTEPNGMVIHMLIGKSAQAASEIQANIKALYNLLGRSKIKKITLSSTMGPGVKVDLSSI